MLTFSTELKQKKDLNILHVIHLFMADVTVSLRVDEQLHNEMKLHDEINWSAIMRKSIKKSLENFNRIDSDRAQHAVKIMEAIRESKVFDKGKSSLEIIREWRDKRQ